MNNQGDGSAEKLVSIVIPGHNYGHFISETLNSVLNQTYTNWECIVVDNGSSDNTIDVVKSFIEIDDRFRVFSISQNTTSATRNFGISKSQGSFLLFLDSDDQIAPAKLAESMKLFDEFPETDLVYSPSKYYNDGEPGILRDKMNPGSHDLLRGYHGNSLPLLEKMVHSNLFTICAPIIRTKKVKAIGGFNDSLNWVEDWDFYIRLLASACEVRYCSSDDSSCLIRVHNRSLSKKNLNMMEQSVDVRKNLERVLKKLPGISSKMELILKNSQEIKFLHRSLYEQYLNHDQIKACRHLWRFFHIDGNVRLLVKGLLGLPGRNNVFS